jgi:hypothetical protein
MCPFRSTIHLFVFVSIATMRQCLSLVLQNVRGQRNTVQQNRLHHQFRGANLANRPFATLLQQPDQQVQILFAADDDVAVQRLGVLLLDFGHRTARLLDLAAIDFDHFGDVTCGRVHRGCDVEKFAVEQFGWWRIVGGQSGTVGQRFVDFTVEQFGEFGVVEQIGVDGQKVAGVGALHNPLGRDDVFDQREALQEFGGAQQAGHDQVGGFGRVLGQAAAQ